MKGLEPPHREALDPKSSVSTNFTTPACLLDDVNLLVFYQRACLSADRSTNLTTPASGAQI